jgi:hypothetical protein
MLGGLPAFHRKILAFYEMLNRASGLEPILWNYFSNGNGHGMECYEPVYVRFVENSSKRISEITLDLVRVQGSDGKMVALNQ